MGIPLGTRTWSELALLLCLPRHVDGSPLSFLMEPEEVCFAEDLEAFTHCSDFLGLP